MKKCFIVCWLGKIPDYFRIWVKSCAFNPEFDFLIFTNCGLETELPENVKWNSFSKEEFLKRARKSIDAKAKLWCPYSICSYRPMYGLIFQDELATYDFWGYCDIDVVFGRIAKFISDKELEEIDAVFNAGHFTLLRNNNEMNHLFQRKGAIFSYKTVIRRNAIFAFDETTGIQRIARKNGINARFGIRYVEADTKYTQIRSRTEKINPDEQAYFWEDGSLFRVKVEQDVCFHQEFAYIHLQKRRNDILDGDVVDEKSFWITPYGFRTKRTTGFPIRKEILKFNPFPGRQVMQSEAREYKRRKIISILKRNPYQIYVRVRQEFAGINRGDANQEEFEWIKC